MILYDLRVKSITQEVSEVLKISFEVMGDLPFTYKAGQFLTLIFNRGDKEVRRSYSFCSSPDVNEDLAIAVKLVENGEISRLLHHQLQVGDRLKATQANGNFTFNAANNTSFNEDPKIIFLFAAGVGITPLFSILKSALLSPLVQTVILVYSNKNAQSVIFDEELKALAQRFADKLHIHYLFSESKLLSNARLNGILLRDIVKKYVKERMSKAIFYTCGPVDYMDMCRITLFSSGFTAEQIKRETFVLPEDELDDDDSSEKVVDKNTYSVILKIAGKEHRFDVPYPKRILDVALENKIAIPYSCSGGVCSTCAATCIKGGVRMDYNEVLTDQDIARGRVLICTGHPTENETTITWS